MKGFEHLATSAVVRPQNRQQPAPLRAIQTRTLNPASSGQKREDLTTGRPEVLKAIPAHCKSEIEAPSTPNLREHWAVRAKRAKQQRAAGKGLMAAWLRANCPPRVLVTLTRQGPRQLDSDNLAAAMKSYRDGIADALRIDDASPLVEWRYAQRKGPAAVEFTIERAP